MTIRIWLDSTTAMWDDQTPVPDAVMGLLAESDMQSRTERQAHDLLSLICGLGREYLEMTVN